MIRVTRWAAAGAAGVILLTAGACNGDPDQPSSLSDGPSSKQTTFSPSASASSSGTAPSTTSSEEQAVIDQYKGFYVTLPHVGDMADDQVRESLKPYAFDAQVEAVVKYVQGLRAVGQTTGGEVIFSPLNVKVTGSAATVSECRNTTSEQILDAVTRAVIKDGAPGTSVSATLSQETSGIWKVQSSSAKSHTC